MVVQMIDVDEKVDARRYDHCGDRDRMLDVTVGLSITLSEPNSASVPRPSAISAATNNYARMALLCLKIRT